MNVVVLVGEVLERPFRPGGDRCVIKLKVHRDQGDEWELIEVDAFGGVGTFAMNAVNPGDLVSVRGRLEDRRLADGDRELRVVGHRINLLDPE